MNCVRGDKIVGVRTRKQDEEVGSVDGDDVHVERCTLVEPKRCES